jgi:MSHA biogenesis protein MshQ
VIWLRNLAFLLACAAASGAPAQVALRGTASATSAAPGGISLVTVTTVQGEAGQATLTLPAAAQAGDVVIAVVAVEDETAASVTAPGAFTQIRGDNANDHTTITSYRVIAAGDTPGATSWVWDWGGTEDYAAALLVFRGADTANPIHAQAGATNNGNSGSINIPALTPTVANTLLVAIASVRSGSTFSNWSDGLVERTDQRSGNGGDEVALGTATRPGPAAGASSTTSTVDISDSDNSREGLLIALQPAPPGLTIAVPAGTALDDVMIASVTVRPCSSTSGAACSVTVGTPAGWTLIRSVNQATGAGTGGYGNRLLVYQKVATAAEPASYTWTLAGTPSHAGAAGAILGFSGVDTASPIVAEAGQATGSAFGHATPSIDTGSQINTVLVSSHSANSAASWAPPAGMTERVDIASIPVPDDLGLGLEVNTQDFPTPGPTGPRTATHSNPPAQDTGATHILALRPLAAVLHWSMDQSSWNGSAGEVLDLTPNGLHGTAAGGASTASATPAIAGNPGTCQYAALDGIDDVVRRADHALLDITDELTVMAWVRPSAYPAAGGLKTIVSKDQNYEFHLNSAGRINWWWGGGARELTSAGAVPLNAWTHVAIVYSRAGAFQRIYIDGAQDLNTNNQNAALTTNNLPFEVGSDQGFAGRQFAGFIDEVRVYRSALSATAIQTIRNQTRPCAASVNHFSISHAGSGVACVDQTVTITAHDASHTAVDAGAVSINLSTSHGRGTWSGIVAGGGVLSDPTAGDGAATYTFAAGSSQVALLFRYTNVSAASETFSFNVVSGGLSEASGAANASDDPSFTMAQAGFTFTGIPTQISGKPSNTGFGAAPLLVTAVDTDAGTGSCTPLFASQNRTIQLGAECNNPGACAGQSVSVNGSNILTTDDNGVAGAGNYGDVTLAFNAASQASIVIGYPAAGQMSLHARYDLNPAVIGYEMIGASNAYVVRPFAFGISGVTTAGAPAPTDPAPYVAGQDFNVTLTAVQWQAGDDGNNDGVADSDSAIAGNPPALNFGLESPPASASLAHALNAPGGGAAGSLGGATSFGGFAAGSRTQAVNWSEVGFINLKAESLNYLGSGQNITNSQPDGLTGVGRFRPDHLFLAAPGALLNRNAACASSFTYLGEPLGLTFTLQARNAAGAVTTNYEGGYARLNTADATRFTFGAVGLNPAAAGTNLSGRATALGTSGAFSSGQASITAAVAIGRLAALTPDGPYTAVLAGVTVQEAAFPAGDGVATRSADFNLDVDGVAGGDFVLAGGPTELRFGRLRLENAVGDQRLDLPIGMRAEYWTGATFALNTADSCTSIAPANIAFGNYLGGVNAGNVNAANLSGLGGAFTGGLGNFVLLRPSGAVAAPGSVDLCVDLGGDASCAATSAARSYLQTRNDPAAAYDDDPKARAAFGLFGGQPGNFIYFRENF